MIHLNSPLWHARSFLLLMALVPGLACGQTIIRSSGWVGFGGVLDVADLEKKQFQVVHPIHCYPTARYHPSVLRVELHPERKTATSTYRLGAQTKITRNGQALKDTALLELRGKGLEIILGTGDKASNDILEIKLK